MALQVVTAHGVTFIEGSTTEPDVVTALMEACFSTGTGAGVLQADQLPMEFFDLSSRVAGQALQRLRNYGIRLAVVVPPGWSGGSSRFGEMVAEERRGRDFGVFESREAAIRWLAE